MSLNNILIDTLVRIKNGYRSNLKNILAIKSKKNLLILNVLYLEGFIKGYNIDLVDSKKINILLKYTLEGKSSLKDIKIISKSGSRIYVKVDDLWQLILSEGLGCFILSTSSRGVITLKEALKYKVGGELLCYVE